MSQKKRSKVLEEQFDYHSILTYQCLDLNAARSLRNIVLLTAFLILYTLKGLALEELGLL